MLVKCINCGAQASLDVMLGGDDNAKAIMAALDLSPIGKQVGRYLCLFRPAKSKLSTERFAKLLSQLSPMIAAQQIEYKRVVYHAPIELWASAIEKVLVRRDLGELSLPLDSHNYLLKIIATDSGRNQSAVDVVEHLSNRDAINRVSTKQLSGTAQALVNLELRKGGNYVAG